MFDVGTLPKPVEDDLLLFLLVVLNGLFDPSTGALLSLFLAFDAEADAGVDELCCSNVSYDGGASPGNIGRSHCDLPVFRSM